MSRQSTVSGATPRRRRRAPLLRAGAVAAGVLGLALGATACSSGASSASGSTGTSSSAATTTAKAKPASHVTVTIQNFAFHPSTVTVKPGAKITVTNKDSVTHTFTSDSNKFNTGDVKPGQTKTVTAPSKPGTYPYMCMIHQFMTGTVIVKS